MARLFKKDGSKVRIINRYWSVEKGTSGGICHSIHTHANANNKYMKNYDKNKESYLMYLDANNLLGWAMCQRFPVGGFKRKIKNIHKLNGGFVKNYDDDSNKGYILEVDVGHLENLLNPHGDLPFLAERKKIKKWLFVI